MKTGNYAASMFAGQWRRELRKFEAEWKRKSAVVERFLKSLKRLNPKTQTQLRRARRRLMLAPLMGDALRKALRTATRSARLRRQA
jgi:hypothetical protein